MIINMHAHIDEVPALGWMHPPETIIAHMDEAGIDKSVVATYVNVPGIRDDAMEYIANACQKYPRLIPFLRVDPWYGERTLRLIEKAVKEYNYQGVKLHPVNYTLAPFGTDTVNILKLAHELDVPVLFHCADEMMSLPLQIELGIKRSPETTVILGHSGGFMHNEDALRVAATYENVYVDTSEFPYPKYIKKIADAAGAEKILFGTDGPTTNPFVEIYKIKLAGLTKEQEDLIFYKNAMKILKMKEV